LDLGDLIKLRTVWIPETIDLLVGSTWLEHLKEFWSKGKLFSSEIWLGHADQHLRFYRRLELEEKYDFSYEFDGKEWETGVTSEIIVYAFNILRSCFRKGSDIDNHFRFIMDTMVFKKIILHNGNTFMCNNGIPSGHAWTALINSICNWVIWTSTFKNCPHIPKAVKQNYSLQVQGDDVKIDTVSEITKRQRAKIIEWMLYNFNYRAKYGGKVHKKSDDVTGLNTASFLKRVVNAKGMIDTPVLDIWEKILTGPEYSGCRSHRMTYLRRRLNDLCIFDSVNRQRLAYYYAFVRIYPKMSHRVEKEMFALLFTLTDGFTTSLINKWEVFFKIFGLNRETFIQTAAYYENYFSKLYEKNFLRYDSKCDYVDYWKERKKSVTVSQILQNYDSIPLWYHKDGFKILHSKRIFKRGILSTRNSIRKNKYNKAIKRLLSF
jgi:hypothetical protein